MRIRLALMALTLGAASPLLAAPHQMVDYDFGTQDVVWKRDGHQLALRDMHGIAIRDAQALRLLRYFPLERDGDGSPVLHSWSGDNLILEKKAGYNSNGHVGDSSALLLSAQTGKTRAIWPGVDFSYANGTLWFRRGQHFRVFDTSSRRWFNASLPLRINDAPDNSWPTQVTFSSNRRFAADQLADGRMRLWNVAAHKITTILKDKVSSQAYPQVAMPVVWSPDGKRVATLGEDPSHVDFTYPEGPNDGTQNEHPPVVKIWDAHTGKLLQWFNPDSSPKNLAWRDNENLLVTGEYSFDLHRVGAKKSAVINAQAPMSLSPERAHLFASYDLIKIGKNNQTRVLKFLFPAPPRLENVSWSPDSHYLAVSYDDQDRNRNDLGGLFIWNASNLSLERAGRAHSPMHIGWTRDNRAWSSDFYHITSWAAQKNWAQNDWLAPFIEKSVSANYSNQPRANGLFLLPDGQRILQLNDSLDHGLYERANASAPATLLFKDAQSGGFSEVLSPDGNYLCFYDSNPANSFKLVLYTYELRVGGRKLEFKDTPLVSLAINFSPDSRFLSWGGNIYQWPSGKIVGRSTPSKEESPLALGPGARLVLLSGKNGIRIANRQGRTLSTLTRNTKDIRDTKFSPNGKHVAIARLRSTEIYAVQSGQLTATLYAWTRRIPTPGFDWLTRRADGKTIGTPTARRLIVSLP